MIDWTQVLILGVPAYIAALGGAVAAIIAALNHRKLRTPSGQRVGRLAEESWELAQTHTAQLQAIQKTVDGNGDAAVETRGA